MRDAQVNGQVDVYWEYTGTSLVTYNKMDSAGLNAKQTYDKVKELDAKVGLTWLNPSKANDTYGLAVQAPTTRRPTASRRCPISPTPTTTRRVW